MAKSRSKAQRIRHGLRGQLLSMEQFNLASPEPADRSHRFTVETGKDGYNPACDPEPTGNGSSIFPPGITMIKAAESALGPPPGSPRQQPKLASVSTVAGSILLRVALPAFGTIGPRTMQATSPDGWGSIPTG